MFVRWFSHKNNHVLKLKEYNSLKLPITSLNNLLQQIYIFIRYQQNKRKKGNHKYFQLVDFDTQAIVPTMKVKCIIGWAKHRTCSTYLWGNFCKTHMAICDTRLLYSHNYLINSSCWLLYIWINSCFESNDNKFTIGMQPTFNPVGTTT
jgi:hypothetical protein